ncbi:MAG: pyridoxamine 5'-phosphate oxidase family protein [Alphaproteobacteria bacterium]|nr:pyridoxamine 5'-phosphate oxidase family protein [Alphaproteobacteria bacterium SS10]
MSRSSECISRTEQATPFHEGERAVQEQAGVRDIENWARKIVRDYFPDQHLEFHTNLPFLVAAARDVQRRPWVTLLTGPEGFVSAPDQRHLRIDGALPAGDALSDGLTDGADLGLLGIELATRRRNRANGRVQRQDDGALLFSLDQSFGNCPQYIRERAWHRVPNHQQGPVINGSALTALQVQWVKQADTFFIASGYRGEGADARFGMDASHRGGDPGFVEILENGRLRFPDFAGNNHFNTIGNLLVDPRVGLLFVDFATGSLLQLTGTAEIVWDGPILDHYPGAQRLVDITIEEVIEMRDAVPLRWEQEADSVRSLRVLDKVQESADVTSFYLGARDDGPLADFAPGQHLPIEVVDPDTGERHARTYSLSNAPGDGGYRISVKREPQGRVSRLLHDKIGVGTVLSARKPSGDFILDHGTSPLLLVSAGVGITPMLSMLESLAISGSTRPATFLHAARDGLHHPFKRVVDALVGGASPGAPGDGLYQAYVSGSDWEGL